MKSVRIKEANNESDDYTNDTPNLGLYITPSKITGRNPVKGFLVTSQSDDGKVGFSDPDGYISLSELSDVIITNPQKGDVLVFDGKNWINKFLKP